MHVDAQDALVALAAIVTAWGVVYRGLVRPLVRAMRRLSDELAALHEATLMARELVQFVSGFVVHTEDRLALLERTAGVEPPEPSTSYRKHMNALAWLERQAQLRDRRRGDTTYPTEPEPA